MKFIFGLLFLFSVSVQANGPSCKPLFQQHPLFTPLAEIQKILNNIEPTTRKFELNEERVNVQDVVVIQLDRDAFDREIIPQIEHLFTSKQDLLEARAFSAIKGIVVGSVMKADGFTGHNEVHLAVYDENASEVYFISESMIDPHGESQIVGHKYNQLIKDPALELEQDDPNAPILEVPESTKIH